MPTRSDFEAAAAKFDQAAQQVGDLTAAAEGADAAAILRGGSLGRQVPQRIAAASSTAAICQGLIQEAADTCRERASIIADYELQLQAYDRSYYYYRRYSAQWQAQYNAWWLDETDTISHPGAHPAPPAKPISPPAWADVRRP